MQLPSNVAKYDDVPLLDLDVLPYEIVCKPPNATLHAWAKAEETERRWTMFDWATFVIPDHHRNRRLIRDFASAFLLSFEATLQVLRHEQHVESKDFSSWLDAHGCNDLTMRGLRTMRHLEAHIRAGHVTSPANMTGASRFAHSTLGGRVPWCWDPVGVPELKELHSAKVSTAELPAWNGYLQQTLVLDVMCSGLKSLNALLQKVGP